MIMLSRKPAGMLVSVLTGVWSADAGHEPEEA
jgi:hypothetical protein